ncbi:MAG: hypothetical protein ABI983_03660, partial [Acidobacteriota bacterium]
AAEELTAATDALKRSEEAVATGDYRQALSHAIDSRDRAQNAAKMAVDGRADARGHAERAVAEVATLLAQAQAQIKVANDTGLSPRILREPQATIIAAEKMLQEARTALKSEDYPTVTKALDDAAGQLQASLTLIDSALSPRPAPRKR